MKRPDPTEGERRRAYAMTPLQIRILMELKATPSTAAELAKALDVSEGKIQQALSDLEEPTND